MTYGAIPSSAKTSVAQLAAYMESGNMTADLAYGDTAIEPGTPLEKSTLCPDYVSARYGLPDETATPAQALALAMPIIKDTITLAAASWSSGQYTITDARILPPDQMEVRVFASPTLNAYDNACVYWVSQTTGSMVVKAWGTVPTVDIPCQIEFVRK